ncbi:MAG: hypothetical protein JNK82_10060 [Myxococcaceae bacterium]|nr:hypothetical protein [Myxococcaceae bacterium]
MSAIVPPSQWTGRRLAILDVLSFVAQEIAAGRAIEMFLGTGTVQALGAFIEGVRFTNFCAGFTDCEFQAFMEWLRDEKAEWPSEGWEAKYLRDAQGDHAAAIRRFLRRADEFRQSGKFTVSALSPWDA